MKICSDCGENKDELEFYKNGRSKKPLSRCKICYNINRKLDYDEDKKDIIVKRTAEKRKSLAILVNSLKNKPCIDCGILYDNFLMDFDHLRDKILPISKMIHENYSIENILKEIEKCELVCCLCHATRTYNRTQETKNSERQWNCYYRNLKILLDAKNKPCDICNIQYEFWQMHFDHINPKEKFANVGSLLLSSENKIRTEIAKCRILCILCHRRETKKYFWD